MKWNKAPLFSLAMLGAAVLVAVEPAFAATDAGVGFNDYKIRCAAAQLLTLTEGNLGALIMIVAGIGTIIASAFGAYRAATSLLVVSIGSFVLRSLVVIFFNADLTYYGTCNQGSASAAGPAEATPGVATGNAINAGIGIVGDLLSGQGVSQEDYANAGAATVGIIAESREDGNVYAVDPGATAGPGANGSSR